MKISHFENIPRATIQLRVNAMCRHGDTDPEVNNARMSAQRPKRVLWSTITPAVCFGAEYDLPVDIVYRTYLRFLMFIPCPLMNVFHFRNIFI